MVIILNAFPSTTNQSECHSLVSQFAAVHVVACPTRLGGPRAKSNLPDRVKSISLEFQPFAPKIAAAMIQLQSDSLDPARLQAS
jgi:hypothetical protein